jgi:hypothetical protein
VPAVGTSRVLRSLEPAEPPSSGRETVETMTTDDTERTVSGIEMTDVNYVELQVDSATGRKGQAHQQ